MEDAEKKIAEAIGRLGKRARKLVLSRRKDIKSYREISQDDFEEELKKRLEKTLKFYNRMCRARIEKDAEFLEDSENYIDYISEEENLERELGSLYLKSVCVADLKKCLHTMNNYLELKEKDGLGEYNFYRKKRKMPVMVLKQEAEKARRGRENKDSLYI